MLELTRSPEAFYIIPENDIKKFEKVLLFFLLVCYGTKIDKPKQS
jgi:hypothetical protein